MGYTIIIGNKNLSSWSLRPWLVLARCGVDFQEILIPLNQPDTRQKILQYSPNAKVPALIHDGLVIWESLAICEYLAEQFPEKKLWPSDPKVRAIARSVSTEMHAGFATLRQNMPMHVRDRFPGKGRAEGVQADIDRVSAIWRECRAKYGQGGPFLFGEFSIADAFFAPVVTRFTTYVVELDDVCKAYVAAIWALPEMQTWLEGAKAE